MSATVGIISRGFSRKCRIFCASVARKGLLSSDARVLPLTSAHGCREFTEDAPSKPKKPLSSFFLFAAQQRPQILAETPDLSVPEVTKRIAEQWRELSDEEKEVYRAEFELQRSRFQEEMEAFRSSLTDEQWDEMTEMTRRKREQRAKRRHRMEMKKLNKPKRPPSGYSLFVKAHLISAERPVGGHSRKNVMALFKEAAEVWKSLPDYEKQQYNEEAARLVEAYREEMEAWKRKMEEEGEETSV